MNVEIKENVMNQAEQKQALDNWFRKICNEIQEESFKFPDSTIPFGAGLAMGDVAKNFKELENIIFAEQK